MIVLSGAELVLPDRIVSSGTIQIEGDRIAAIRRGAAIGGSHSHFALHGHYLVPGFIDVHVHGVDGVDSLSGADAVSTIAASLPRYGVTAFCPTTVACAPDALAAVLAQVRVARQDRAPGAARVLPAHLESNFINPAFAGAQPVECLRMPREHARDHGPSRPPGEGAPFTTADVLREIERASPDVAIVTLAPELDGGLELIQRFVAAGHHVSLGHSAATYEEARVAISAGARQATHLFNRMPPLHHREPGLAGAVLQSEEVAAEIICDGVHVHPAMVRATLAAKHPSRVMAITDGTALAGLPAASSGRLGGHTIHANGSAAYLADGTLAGSTLTMDRAFRSLVTRMGVSPVDAAILCATTPARELGLVGHGVIAEEAIADLVVLDAAFEVVQTYIGGQLVYARSA
jgi:N-acetylglucosamine-6-phosphate deacetylase